MDVIAIREEIDKELAALFGGIAPARTLMRCGAFGEEGHTTKTCPAVAGRNPRPPPPVRSNSKKLVPVLRSRPARTHRVSAPIEHDKSRPERRSIAQYIRPVSIAIYFG